MVPTTTPLPVAPRHTVQGLGGEREISLLRVLNSAKLDVTPGRVHYNSQV